MQMYNVRIGLTEFYFNYFCLFYFALVSFLLLLFACFSRFFFFIILMSFCVHAVYANLNSNNIMTFNHQSA